MSESIDILDGITEVRVHEGRITLFDPDQLVEAIHPWNAEYAPVEGEVMTWWRYLSDDLNPPYRVYRRHLPRLALQPATPLPHQATVQPSLLPGVPDKTHRQRKVKPAQMEMFTARQLVEGGIGNLSWVGDFPGNKLVLQSEDPRTDEQREADRRRAAEDQTEPLFDE